MNETSIIVKVLSHAQFTVHDITQGRKPDLEHLSQSSCPLVFNSVRAEIECVYPGVPCQPA